MFWYAAYLRPVSSPLVVREGVLKTIPSFAPPGSRFLEDHEFQGYYHYVAGEWNLLVVSPPRAGTIGIWGTTPRFLHRLFRDNSFSGILLELEDDKDFNYWAYMLFEEGNLADWFTSDPEENFDSWGDASVQRYLAPYLTGRTGQPGLQIDRLVPLPPGPFLGRPQVLERNALVRKGLLREDVASSFVYPRASMALGAFLSSLEVPYNTTDIDPANFGVYLDVKTRRINQAQWTDVVGMYEKITSISDLEEFSYLLFDFKGRDYPDGFVY